MVQQRQTTPSTKYVIAGMAAGALFFLFACALMGWHYLVAPVPRPLVLTAVGLGVLAATAILVATVLYGLASTKGRRG